MDVHQIASMIEWLDEERRRDKNAIVVLEERIVQQAEIIDKLQKRLNGVESDQTVLRSKSQTGQQVSYEVIDNLRHEVRQMVEGAESRRLKAEREAEKRGELTRENVMRTVIELNEKIKDVERRSGEVTAIRSERDRFTDTIAILQQRIEDLSKQVNEPNRRITYLEEQRRQDTRRLSGAETELPELKKQVEGLYPKIDLLEQLALRNEKRIQEVQNSDRDRRDQIQQFIDEQNLILQQRNHETERLVKQMQEQESVMKTYADRFETWAQAYREMKRIIDDFERIGDRLERRINEVAEMQRLSEERFRQEWNDWRDEDQKRWKQFNLANDELWRGHDKEFEQFTRRIGEIGMDLPALQDSINQLWELERRHAQLYRERSQALLLEIDRAAPPANGNGSNR